VAVINFSEADKLAGRLMDKGPATVQISEIDGPKASQSQKSVNYFLTIQVTKGPFMNKEFSICVNSETKEPSLLGTMQFFPQVTFGKIIAAIRNIKFEDLPVGNLDTDECLLKPFDVIVSQEIVAGNIINTIGGSFYPAGTAAAIATAKTVF
jgi:hypothetical protein